MANIAFVFIFVFSLSLQHPLDPSIYGNSTGWFNSITGVVKRRIASYVKLHFATGEKDKDKELRDRDRDRDRESKVKSGATVGPMLYNSTNPFAQTTHPSMIQPPSAHVLSGIDRRHRSPDPPPRYR